MFDQRVSSKIVPACFMSLNTPVFCSKLNYIFCPTGIFGLEGTFVSSKYVGGMWGCFLWCSTYHCYGVDRVHDGEQQDVVLGKVPIVYRTSCNTECELSDEGKKKSCFLPQDCPIKSSWPCNPCFFFKFGCCFLYKKSYMCHRINADEWC